MNVKRLDTGIMYEFFLEAETEFCYFVCKHLKLSQAQKLLSRDCEIRQSVSGFKYFYKYILFFQLMFKPAQLLHYYGYIKAHKFGYIIHSSESLTNTFTSQMGLKHVSQSSEFIVFERNSSLCM